MTDVFGAPVSRNTLLRLIKGQGYPHGYGNVRNYVGRTLRGKPQPVEPRPPSARAVTRWILTHLTP
jgi:hypothetical protein